MWTWVWHLWKQFMYCATRFGWTSKRYVNASFVKLHGKGLTCCLTRYIDFMALPRSLNVLPDDTIWVHCACLNSIPFCTKFRPSVKGSKSSIWEHSQNFVVGAIAKVVKSQTTTRFPMQLRHVSQNKSIKNGLHFLVLNLTPSYSSTIWAHASQGKKAVLQKLIDNTTISLERNVTFQYWIPFFRWWRRPFSLYPTQ